MKPSLVLVTGASRREGIGFEICRQLGNMGYEVILTARNLSQAIQRAEELQSAGLKVTPLSVDISNQESIDALLSEVTSTFGRLDVLINNAAGVAPYGELASTADLKTAQTVLETTLLGNWRMIQSSLALLRKSSHARIVNVSSGAGSHGDTIFGLTTQNSMGTSYAVSKAALNALTAKLALELASEKILVNAVCPGFTATFEGGEAMGARPVSDGAASVVWAATLPDDGPTGGLFRDGKPLAW